MFTGIIKKTAKVISNAKKNKGYELVLLSNLKCKKKILVALFVLMVFV